MNYLINQEKELSLLSSALLGSGPRASALLLCFITLMVIKGHTNLPCFDLDQFLLLIENAQVLIHTNFWKNLHQGFLGNRGRCTCIKELGEKKEK